MRKKLVGYNALGILSLIDVRFLLEAMLSSQTRLHFIRYIYKGLFACLCPCPLGKAVRTGSTCDEAHPI